MLYSFANAAPRNIESVRVQDLIPSSFSTGAKNLVDLLEYYYNYLNTVGLPTLEIASISSLKDIDAISLKYIDQIEELIGKNIPASKVLNRVELYKLIVRYYNTRGSEDSVHSFFKIFFNQLVEIIYPKELLFDLSGATGRWDGPNWVYENHKSFPSDNFKIFDGHYWQDYSYVVRSDLDSSVWYDDYLRFVHPAGLKLFSAIVIEIILRNRWDTPIDYSSSDLSVDDSWLQGFIPPYNRDRSNGYHSPKYQPGYLRDSILKYIFTYLLPQNNDDDLLRLVIVDLKYFLGGKDGVDVRNSFVRAQYQASEKFVDTLEIGAGMLDKTNEQAEELYSNTNRCRFTALSVIIGSRASIDYSYYDEDGGDGVGAWSSSSYDEDGGDGVGAWSSSSYDTNVIIN